MFTIRPYRESDAESVGRLIADTYSEFNLSFASADELEQAARPLPACGVGGASPS